MQSFDLFIRNHSSALPIKHLATCMVQVSAYLTMELAQQFNIWFRIVFDRYKQESAIKSFKRMTGNEKRLLVAKLHSDLVDEAEKVYRRSMDQCMGKYLLHSLRRRLNTMVYHSSDGEEDSDDDF